MNLTRHSITAGVAALALAVSASPALAKGGGDGAGDGTSGVVTFVSPDLLALVAANNAAGGSGKGGSNRPSTCRATGAVDPVTGSIIMVCTQNRV
jgi:hypothetical protein